MLTPGAANSSTKAAVPVNPLKSIPALANIPQELKEMRQWIVWKYGVDDQGRPTKHPYQAHATQWKAKSNDHLTWNTFEKAVQVAATEVFSGVGFMFSETDSYCGIDLDKCRNMETGKIQEWAVQYVKRLASYTELSPSGLGLHIIIRGKVPPGGNHKGHVEMYSQLRYFTMTGHHLEGTPTSIKDRQAELEALHREVFGEAQERPQEPTRAAMPLDFSDRGLLDLALRKDEKFSRLWEGNTSGYDSPSEADYALAHKLSFWTNKNPERIDRLFRQSGLCQDPGRLKKWERLADKTIAKAIANTPEGYNPGQGTRRDRDNGGKRPMPAGKETTHAGGGGAHPQAKATPAKPKILPLGGTYHLTDMGNAQRLVARHGKDLRYCYPWGKWLVWDEARWKKDDTGEIERRAKDTVRSIYSEAAATKNEDKSKALAQFALKCHSENKRKAMIESAKSEPGIPILPEHLDRDPWLLNVLNGTLDLRTGTLRLHNQADMITKLAPVEYDPGAKCPKWDAFLDKVLAGNVTLIKFLQKAVGYALTGSTREQCLFFLYGLGANGKSTFLNIMQALLGDYATQTNSETLMVKHGGGHIPNDLAALRGARFVAAVEVEAGRRVAESLIKQMTGGDKISARFMRAEYFEFDPEFKIFLAANHKPVIKGTDNAIWRRIHLIPFTVQIPQKEQDRGLPEKLKTELSGILNWGIAGGLQCQYEGLNPPETVQAATQEYREDMDPLGGFLAECCMVAPGAEAMAADLYKAYSSWAEDNGEKKIMSQTELATRLKELNLVNSRETKGLHKGKKKWKGIGLTESEG